MFDRMGLRFTAGLSLALCVGACGGGDDSAGSAGSGALGGTGGGATGGAGGAGGSGEGGPDASAGTGGAAQGTQTTRFVGRFDFSDGAGPRFAWSGSRIVARFSGTGIGVRLGDDSGANFFDVRIDGTPQPKLHAQAGARDYPLATGLADGMHDVELYRLTEASQGNTQFLGFSPVGGALAPVSAAPDRRLEIVGDSITCGYGDEGADMNCHFTPDTENHYLSYGAVAARDLQADLVTVAWSGKGVVYNYGEDMVDPMPKLYDRILPLQPEPKWDFSRYEPHAVVVNLGTNDFSTDGDPTEQVFTDAYAALLARIRTNYPDAFILCICAPLLSGADYTMVAGYEGQVVTQMQGAGDKKVKFVDLTTDAVGWGCDWHPSVATHAAMAAKLVAELKADLGW
jgi:lysophospholipase L1-like esterase